MLWQSSNICDEFPSFIIGMLQQAKVTRNFLICLGDQAILTKYFIHLTNLEKSVKIISLLIAFCLTCVVTGCNTIEGMGKDVEAAGDAIEKKASENKNY